MRKVCSLLTKKQRIKIGSDLYLCVGCWYWYNDPVATVRFQSWKISEKLERGENIYTGKATIGEESRKREEKKVSQSHSTDWNVCQQKMKWDKFRLQRKQIIISVEFHQEHILLNGRSMKVAIHSQTEQSPPGCLDCFSALLLHWKTKRPPLPTGKNKLQLSLTVNCW